MRLATLLRLRASALVVLAAIVAACAAAQNAEVRPQDPQPATPAPTQQPQQVKKDVPYVPTPQNVVEEMLTLANVSKNDVVYDLGCGVGRLVITAVKKFGANRGFGVLFVDQSGRGTGQLTEVAGHPTGLEVGCRQRVVGTIRALEDDQCIQHPDQSPVDEVEQGWNEFSVDLLSLELDH